jgi:hypothetical protein
MRHETTTTEIMEFLREHMATKEDIADIRSEMATKEDLSDVRREMATKEDLEHFATKSDLKETESRLMGHIDAVYGLVTRFDAELTAQRARVDRLERHTGILGA